MPNKEEVQSRLVLKMHAKIVRDVTNSTLAEVMKRTFTISFLLSFQMRNFTIDKISSIRNSFALKTE